MRFSFIHAADLHIDSPFAGLGVKDAAVAARFAEAGRKAVDHLIDAALGCNAAFVIIAGDVFDGDWKDVTTGLFFVRALARLDRAGIPVVMVRGNHDAESVMSRSLTWPGSVRSFASDRAETIAFESHRVALHGRSFGGRTVGNDFVTSYPPRREGWLNIGVLHTALDGTRGHASYAPCTPDDLRRFGYDYWALGHIHAPEIVSREPWIVFPGNLQGRSIRETGAKGAVRVDVEDGRIAAVEPLVLDAARWAHEDVDVTSCAGEDDVLALIRQALERLHDQAGQRPLAVRLTLTGVTAEHARFTARQQILEDEARARGFATAEDCWVEQLQIATAAPPRPDQAAAASDMLEIGALLDAAASDPAFAETVASLLASVSEKLPRALRDELAAGDPATVQHFAAIARDHLSGSLGE